MNETKNLAESLYDLVVIGGTAGGISAAIDAQKAGLARVRIVEEGHAVAFPELVGDHLLDVGYGESVSSVELEDDHVVVQTARQTYRARTVLIAKRSINPNWAPSIRVSTPSSGRISIDDLPEFSDDLDIMLVGYSDHAVELTAALAATGASVVVAAGGFKPSLMSRAGETMLRKIEHERRATILYRSVPDQIGEIDGFPMAFFDDRRTPDLQFDHVIFASGRTATSPAELTMSEEATRSQRVWFLGDEAEIPGMGISFTPSWQAWECLAKANFPDIELRAAPTVTERRRRHVSEIDELREENYNATITHFEPTHSDLWVLRVSPDHGDTSHLPGQYASLGLGFWEDRIDEAEDPDLEHKWDKLIRRSYSISSRMYDECGYLMNETDTNELEFYIVLVPPTEDNIPALTPRLALKRPGDRIYLGSKVAGRYTLAPVTNPSDTVLFLSTGTGEAPHNGMIIELLRKGHRGPIVSAVSVRQAVDLGYEEKHRELESRYTNYHYLPMPTREPDIAKRYIQDLFRDGTLVEDLGISLDAETAHVFLCGNPAMIGLAEDVDGVEKFPEVVGVVELLTERGFVVDKRGQRGNIHFEEYW